jgi:hypothetical protein
MFARRSMILPALLSLTWICATQAAAPPAEDLVQAVIAGNWSLAVQKLPHDSQPDAVGRIIAGHAYLATNRANDAVCAFASVTSDADLAGWQSWTGSLIAAHPALGTPHYLHADALARRERWVAARAEFDRALKIAPGTPLFLNARALTAAATLDWQNAIRDLTDASKVGDAPIDIRVNQAMLPILRRDDLREADARFEAILGEYPSHGIALIGRGAAAAVARHWRTANAYYAKAAAATPCIPLAADNILLSQGAELSEQHATLLAANNPGTSILLGSVTASQTQTQNAMLRLTSTSSYATQIDKLQTATMQMQIWTGLLGGVKNVADTMSQIAVAGMAQKIIPMTPQTVGAVAGIAFASGGLQHMISSNQSLLDQSYHLQSQMQMNQMQMNRPIPSVTAPSQSGTPGGLNSEPPPGSLDRGQWPVVIWPVLLYHLTSPRSG